MIDESFKHAYDIGTVFGFAELFCFFERTTGRQLIKKGAELTGCVRKATCVRAEGRPRLIFKFLVMKGSQFQIHQITGCFSFNKVAKFGAHLETTRVYPQNSW